MHNTPYKLKKSDGSEHEVLFTNKFILTKATYNEYARMTFTFYHQKWRNIVLIASILVFIASFAILYGLHLIIPFFIGILIGLYLLLMSWVGYKYGAYGSYRNMAAMLGEPIEMEVLFHPKYFTVHTTQGDRDFLYNQVSRRIETNNLGILIVENEGSISHGQIIDKRAFSPEELMKYYDLMAQFDFK